MVGAEIDLSAAGPPPAGGGGRAHRSQQKQDEVLYYSSTLPPTGFSFLQWLTRFNIRTIWRVPSIRVPGAFQGALLRFRFFRCSHTYATATLQVLICRRLGDFPTHRQKAKLDHLLPFTVFFGVYKKENLLARELVVACGVIDDARLVANRPLERAARGSGVGGWRAHRSSRGGLCKHERCGFISHFLVQPCSRHCYAPRRPAHGSHHSVCLVPCRCAQR